MKKKPVLIVICGPTASGKTRLAVELASHFHTEILSADSRQFYRELNIGTAKPSVEEKKSIPHHFIDSLSISEAYSAGDYERDAVGLLDSLFEKYGVVIMVGGSGLFLDAVCKGLDHFPEIPAKIRSKVRQLHESEGLEGLLKVLHEADPVYFETVDQQNPHRITRALEVIYTTGRPFSSFRKEKISERSFSVIKIALHWERQRLYARINDRVDEMLENGLEEEARQLLPFRNMNALQTVGYREWFPYFDGEYGKEEAIRLIKRNSRRYAKRQLTWFRKDPSIRYFPGDTPDSEIIMHLDNQINA